MKSINEIAKYFPSEGLATVLLGNKEKVKKEDAIQNLFRSKEREKYIPCFLDDVVKIPKEHDQDKYIMLFQGIFEGTRKELSADTCTKCDAVITKFMQRAKQKSEEQTALREKLNISNELEKAEFPLQELAKTSKDLLVLDSFASVIEKATQIKIPTVSNSSTLLENLFGRNRKSLFPKASEMHLPGGQHFILTSCPTTIQEASAYFDMLIASRVRTSISLHQVGEVGPESALWTPAVLNKLQLRDGLKISCIDEKEVARGSVPSFPPAMQEMKLAKDDEKYWYPRVVERTLVVKQGDETKATITHFHYENWHDYTHCPDESLIEQLIIRKNEIAKPEEGCAINCKAGIGRTGFVATAILSTDNLRAQMANGKTSDALTCNIAKPLFNVRCGRPSVCVSGERLGRLSRFMNRYNDSNKLKALTGVYK